MQFQWLGGPTFLLEWDQFRVLTDPMFGEGPAAFVMNRHPSTGATQAPIARMAPLPPAQLDALDLVLVSHLHRDHFDAPAAERLDINLRVAVPRPDAFTLRQWGFARVWGLVWWEYFTLEKDGARLRVTALPARHAADDDVNADMGVVNGYLIEYRAGSESYTIYWTGDTVWFDGLTVIREHSGHPDLLVPHMGAVGVDGPRGRLTLDATEATHLIDLFQPATVIPVHYHTFAHYVEPIDRLETALQATPYADRLIVLREGETWATP
jgi:L-ascorbate metabolism protein UlaG (beta-lactamase superfamily)